jgi:hypothetical protein
MWILPLTATIQTFMSLQTSCDNGEISVLPYSTCPNGCNRFRELPESVFTNHLYNDFIETISALSIVKLLAGFSAKSLEIPDYDERKIGIRTLIWQLPQPNFDVLRRLMEHLDR